MEAPDETTANIRALMGAEVLRRRAAEARAQRTAETQREARESLAAALGYEIDQAAFERLAALPAWARQRVPALAPCPNADQMADVPPPFVFRVVGADGIVARCVDARLLNHLDRLGGANALHDALTRIVRDALAPDVALDDAVSGAVSEAVDINAARFKARWRQVDPERGVEPLPIGQLSAIMRPVLADLPRLLAAADEDTGDVVAWEPDSAAEDEIAWDADPAGQRLSHAAIPPGARGNVARAIGIGASPIILPPALFGQWFAAATEGPAVPASMVAAGSAAAGPAALPADAAGRLMRITYEQPAGSGRLVRALATRISADDDASGRAIYADVFGTTMGFAPGEVLEEAWAQPFVGLAAYSTDPALPGVAYGYALAGKPSMPTTEALVPYDVLWNLWGGSEHPTDVSLPPPLSAAAARHIENTAGLSNIVLAPTVFPLGAAVILAPAARDAQEALDAYARATRGLPGTQQQQQSSPIKQVLDRAFMLADGQMLVVPPQLWAPAHVREPVAFVVRRLFGYVRRAPHAPGAYEVARVPVITVGGSGQGSHYAVDIEPAEVPTPPTSYDALAAYYAAGPNARARSESAAGDVAEAAAIETALRAQRDGGLAVGLTGALPPTLAVIMASREAPTPRERAHWSQFLRRVARAAGGSLPEPPWTVPPRALAGLHVAPLPAAAGTPGVGSLSATALAINPAAVGRRVFRYDTARGVWHDVSLVRPALPSLSDRELEDLLLALPQTPDGPRAPLMTVYLVGPDGAVTGARDIARTVTFAPEAVDAAERQEGRRRVEAQRAQVQSRARSRAAAAAEARATQQQQRQPQPPPQETGSVLGRRRQPPTPTPPSPTPLRPTVPPGLAQQAAASLARLLASPAPRVVADLVGVSVERVRDILQSDAWLAVVAGDDADASALAARPADPRTTDPAAPSVLDVVDNAVYEFTGVGPEIIAEVVDRTTRDRRWTPAVDGPATPRRVLGVVAAAYDPVVRTRSADPDSNASAVLLNHVYFALARRNAQPGP
ncbi:hypothetical protein psal_cds_481 [Pandoravirus salinus]|uniref:Uncharacterized protein n=1 Tax=Pandoravirus salinus TaxID=1349410 RepID=S4VV54_9VIRU|nr:hypothetical protein psal_cds_481 [Pandoravirus salinus]AGO84258.1 hypothetical protein psal_cds_481 [Pandoravirus salinus]